MSSRIDWVDRAKGLCIIMVVMMHTTLGVGEALGQTGFMHYAVAFAKPFRMPDFFLISGLFLAAVIDRDWRTYLDRKVVHFLYFYILWTAIQLTVKAPGLIGEMGTMGLIERAVATLWAPFGTLWFLYILPLFFVLTKLMRRVPAVLFAFSAALYLVHNQIAAAIAPVHEQAFMVLEVAQRFVFFVVGYLAAPQVFRLMDRVRLNPPQALAAIGVWAVANGALVWTGLADYSVIGLPLGLAGAMAIAASATLVATGPVAAALRYLGEHSIVVYLAFFLPMAALRAVLIRLGFTDAGWIALAVTIFAVIVPVLLYELTERLRIGRFLFHRPAAFWLSGTVKRRAPALQPAPAE